MKSKVLTGLLSVAIAFGLWLYVITVERTQIEQTFYNVPVVLDGESVLEDRGLMITSNAERTVTLKLSGNRSDLNKLKSSDITVLVDLTRIYEAGDKTLSYDISFPGDVQNSAIEVVSRQPDSIKLTVAQWATKEIPVRIETVGTPAQGFKVDEANISASPNGVDISGPKELIDQIAMGKITVDMNGVKESYEQRQKLTLCDANGDPIDTDLSKVFVDDHMILVKVPVLMEREITLKFDIIPGGGLTEKDVKISMGFDDENYTEGPVVITVLGSPAVVSQMNDVITLDERNLKEYTVGETGLSYQIPIPDGVKVVQGDTVFVSWEITSTTYTNPIRISNTQFRIKEGSVPVGYEVEFQTLAIRVILRSTNASVSELTASDIQVVVDLTGITEIGKRFQVPVEIVVNEKNVGVVEEKPYEVYAVLKPLNLEG
jgi:YbbR domain-containing protein